MVLNIIIIVLAIISGLLMLWRIPLACQRDGDVSCQTADHVPETLSIIVPARNEALRLRPLLESLSQQTVRPLEFIVVDDDSSDETARIAQEGGAHVIRSESLSDGWIGKSRACWSGARQAKGDWLLFLDADTKWSDPDGLACLIATFRSLGGRGALSFQPYHEVKRLYESLSAIFNIIVMAGMGVFTPWGEKLRGAGLFGPCLICRRADYFAVGGHEAIRGNVMDDLALGDSFRKAGLPVHCRGGRGLISFRMYPEGIGQLIEGWTKNFGSAAIRVHPFVLTLIILWICGGFSLMTLLSRAILTGDRPWILAGLVATVAYASLMVWLARRIGSFHPLVLILFPVLLVFFALVFFWSLYLTRVLHRVSWRGRRIKV